MNEIIVFPDVVQLVIDALEASLDVEGRLPGIRAVGPIPNPRPAEFFRVMRGGGPRETLVSENATILLEGWAGTDTRAGYLLNLGLGVLFAQDGTLFGARTIGGPTNLPDPTTKQNRMTSTIGIRVRGSALA